MILQPRYNPKLNDALHNSRDFYQYHNKHMAPPRQPAAKLEQLSFSQRQKNSHPKEPVQSESLNSTQHKNHRLVYNNQQDFVPTYIIRHQQSLQDEAGPSRSNNYFQSTTQNMLQYQEIESCNLNLDYPEKKMLPPLRLVAEKARLQEKQTESKERTDHKQASQETPTLKQSLARKHTVRGPGVSDQKQKSEVDNNLAQLGRTSSTPFMQKSKDLNLTSRSGTPAQELSPQSPLKSRKKVVPKQQTQSSQYQKQRPEKKVPPTSQIQQTQTIKILDNLERKVVARKKKKLNQSIILQQQQTQKEKLTLRHTSYRCFLNKINFTNNLCITSTNRMEIPAYSVYIGKGNNSGLIKSLFRQRWWWVEIEQNEILRANMVWTQLKQNSLIMQLPQYNQQEFWNNSSNNESFIASREETVGDTSDSDIEMKPKSSTILNKYQQQQQQQQQQQTKSTPQQKSQAKKPQNFFALKRILNPVDLARLLSHMEETNIFDSQLIFSDCSEKLLKEIKSINTIQKTDSKQYHMHNHMEDNWHLGNKKALFYNMRHYFRVIKEDYTKYIPVTFHIQNGINDEQYLKFVEHYNRRSEELKELQNTKYVDFRSYDRKERKKQQINLWIVKPGELTNRGNGITVCSDLNEINRIITEELPDGRTRTYIVQQYIDNPLLYNKRKFDIRCYMLLTSQNGILKGYWYTDGYIRTSSKEFTTKCLNKYIHLTNDAVQSKDEDYGKFELGNKISFIEFQRYLDSTYPQQKFNFFFDIYPRMRSAALDMIKASYGKIDPYRRANSFELYGLDFMIDDNFKLWLIEANTNPCLELSCPILSRIIPAMVENLFRIAIDPIFPPPFFEEWPQNKKLFIPDNVLENNKFELIFDELIERRNMITLFKDAKIEQEIFQIEEEEEEEGDENE